MSDLEFWQLTWDEFQALSEAKGDEDEKENRRFGRLMALWFNMNRGKGQTSKTEEDFIPTRNKQGTARSKQELSNQITEVFGAFM